MNKFKVGDKIVRVACDWSDMPIFSEWVVSSVPNDVEVQVCRNIVTGKQIGRASCRERV